MACRYSKWLAYLVLVYMAFFIGLGMFGLKNMPMMPSMLVRDIFCVVLWTCIFALLLYAYIYLNRHSVRITDTDLCVRGAFRTKVVPLSLIAQVITANSPRSGTASWLFDKNDCQLEKIDNGLEGFGLLVADLREKLRPYRSVFYRRADWNKWEMQVAGDYRWVPCEAPTVVKKEGRRIYIIIGVGCILAATFMLIIKWLN